MELVEADTYRALLSDYQAMRELVLRLAGTRPRDGQWEAGYRSLQARARDLLGTLERH